MGRKSRYESHVQPFLEQVKEWYGLLNESQIASKLGVGATSFEKYKREHAELREALSRGKEELVLELKSTLKKKAKGFEYEETKTYIRSVDGKETKIVERYKRYSPPDTGAIHLLLKNLDETWRNDDRETMDLKRQRLEMEKEKNEANNW